MAPHTGPQRIVCLTPETVDILYRIGAGERVVGVSAYTRQPSEARCKPFVSAFTTIDDDRIDALSPDLVIAFSDLQADAVARLARRGHNVLLTNQRSLEEMFQTVLLLGRIVDRPADAEALVDDMQQQVALARHKSQEWQQRPRVYFEEWDAPLITGIRWVSELIEITGGRDIFAQLAEQPGANQRIVSAGAVLEAAPDIIIASWCGKPVRLDAIRSRPDWQQLPAVRDDQLHTLPGGDCLQPGPAYGGLTGLWKGRCGSCELTMK